MLTTVRLVLTFGETLYPLLSKLYDSTGNWKRIPSGPDADVTDEEDMTYMQLREMLPTDDRLKAVGTMVGLQRYTRRNLLADLTDLQATMQVVLKS
jgi:hypothetical protein